MNDGPIIVTGACGFVGKWLLRALAERIPQAAVIATSSRPGEADEVVDVCDAAGVDAIIEKFRPSAVVNLAALSFVPDAEANPQQAYGVNLFGPMHLARAVMRHAPSCRFMFIGSSEVYGASFRDRDGPLDEYAPLEPTNVYAASKAAADLLMGQYARRGLQVVRFRPFNHFGPGQSSRFVIPNFARQIVAAETHPDHAMIQVGNLDSERDFLDVRDVVDAYASAIARLEPLPAGTVLNIASGVPRRISHILDSLISFSAVRIEIQQAAARYRASDVKRAIGDPSRARTLLDWTPRRRFHDTLREVFEEIRDGGGPSLSCR